MSRSPVAIVKRSRDEIDEIDPPDEMEPPSDGKIVSNILAGILFILLTLTCIIVPTLFTFIDSNDVLAVLVKYLSFFGGMIFAGGCVFFAVFLPVYVFLTCYVLLIWVMQFFAERYGLSTKWQSRVGYMIAMLVVGILLMIGTGFIVIGVVLVGLMAISKIVQMFTN